VALYVGLIKGEEIVYHSPLCRTPSCPLTRILGGKKRVECEVEKERTNGIRIPYILTATPFRGPGDKLIGVVEDFKDITELKKAEEALLRSQKLKALGEMAAGVAHDFNNLLISLR
jgi:C4-dicarboxylate-specific signal transduction histidine kinase